MQKVRLFSPIGSQFGCLYHLVLQAAKSDLYHVTGCPSHHVTDPAPWCCRLQAKLEEANSLVAQTKEAASLELSMQRHEFEDKLAELEKKLVSAVSVNTTEDVLDSEHHMQKECGPSALRRCVRKAWKECLPRAIALWGCHALAFQRKPATVKSHTTLRFRRSWRFHLVCFK